METTNQETQQGTQTSNPLQRSIDVVIPRSDVESAAQLRLKKMAKTAKMPGFRPGKVPMKLIAQNHGYEAFSEALEEELQAHFAKEVKTQALLLAGPPAVSSKESSTPEELAFSFTFEVYPQITIGDLSTQSISRPVLEVTDAEVDKTIEVLRKQRTSFEEKEHGAQEGDRIVLDFTGRSDGQSFEGGSALDFPFVIGSGHMLSDFDAAVRGLSAGESKTFQMRFPDDYHAKSLAGADVEFDVVVHKVQSPKLPELDAEFARALGVADGDLDKMRQEVRANLEREVRRRIEMRIKEQAIEAVLAVSPFPLPRTLVEKEQKALVEQAREDFEARGLRMKELPIKPEWFLEKAERRVKIGLILAEVISVHGLTAKAEQAEAILADMAQSYEDPQQMIQWFRGNPDQMRQFYAMASESNAVAWILEKAQVQDSPITFEELMNDAAT
jgi:trigger factor